MSAFVSPLSLIARRFLNAFSIEQTFNIATPAGRRHRHRNRGKLSKKIITCFHYFTTSAPKQIYQRSDATIAAKSASMRNCALCSNLLGICGRTFWCHFQWLRDGTRPNFSTLSEYCANRESLTILSSNSLTWCIHMEIEMICRDHWARAVNLSGLCVIMKQETTRGICHSIAVHRQVLSASHPFCPVTWVLFMYY